MPEGEDKGVDKGQLIKQAAALRKKYRIGGVRRIRPDLVVPHPSEFSRIVREYERYRPRLSRCS